MDGIIMNQFQRFVVSRFGREAWPALTAAAGIPLAGEPLAMAATYPDEYLMDMVPAASRLTGIPVPELLEQFGAAIAPALLRVYEPLIKPTWRTLEVIENTEASIHTVVRQRRQEAAPPQLRVERRSADEVAIDYRSTRKLCWVAVGIAHGLALHFRETVHVEQRECMHRGDARCLILVQRRSA